MFEVICQLSGVSNINELDFTNHCKKERFRRISKIINKIGGYGVGKYSFIIDTNHPNGNEIHTITDNGIIIIQNERTKKYVTCLIARPMQIRRYFNNDKIPTDINKIIDICFEHQKNGYNSW